MANVEYDLTSSGGVMEVTCVALSPNKYYLSQQIDE